MWKTNRHYEFLVVSRTPAITIAKLRGGRGGKVCWNPERVGAEDVQENTQRKDMAFSTVVYSLPICAQAEKELTSSPPFPL